MKNMCRKLQVALSLKYLLNYLALHGKFPNSLVWSNLWSWGNSKEDSGVSLLHSLLQHHTFQIQGEHMYHRTIMLLHFYASSPSINARSREVS